MADTNYNVNIQVSDNGTADNVRKSIKDLNSTVKDLSSQSASSTSDVGSFSKSLSDLSVNTSGARREFIVLAHELSQGNFTRFGQSLLVMAERMDALALLVSPVGIGIAALAGGVALMAVAATKGAAEQNKLNAELALTANFAGTTSGNLREMTGEIGAATNNFTGAKEAVNQLTIAGRFTVDQIHLIATAAANMSRITGEHIDKIVGDYIKLADSPTKAAAELNKQYNFLTVALYDQIAALEKAGKSSDASALAMDALAKRQTEATAQIKDNMGTLQRAAAASAEAFHHWWDEVLGIGRKSDANSALADLDKQIEFAKKQVSSAQAMGNSGKAEQNNVEMLMAQRQELMKMKEAVDDNAAAQGRLTQANQKAVEGENYLNTHAKEYTSKIQQRREELEKLVQAAKDAGKSQAEIDKITAGFNANNKDTIGRKATNDDLSTKIETIRGNIEAERITLKSALDTLQADYAKGNLTYAEYVSKKETAQADELQKELEYTEKMEALSKSKVDKSGVEAQRYLNQENDLRAKIKGVHDQANADLAVYEKHAAELIDSIQKTADRFNRDNEVNGHKGLGQYFMTSDEQKFAEQRTRILDEYARLEQQLGLDLKQNKISADDYTKALTDLNDKRYEALDTLQNTEALEKKFQSSFTAGWKQAFRQYVEDSNNTFKMAQDAFTSLASNMEDALTKFATTGKLSFSDFARSVLADLARIAAKAATSGIMKLIGGALGVDTGGAMSGGASTTIAGDVLVAAANGAVIEGGVRKFASGGVVTSPTAFPMVGGSGLMGEAGPEAIMPLSRDASGRLGVVTAGGGSGGLNIGSIVINVQGGNTNEETAATIKKEMLVTMQQIADGRIANAKRSGGLLTT